LSRIIAVGERFDDMTSNRSYRKVISQKEAIEEIKRNVGTHYDPEIVEALEREFVEER